MVTSGKIFQQRAHLPPSALAKTTATSSIPSIRNASAGAGVSADTPAPADAFRMEGIDDVAVVFAKADGGKCARCWKILPDVTTENGICGRCDDVVSSSQ